MVFGRILAQVLLSFGTQNFRFGFVLGVGCGIVALAYLSCPCLSHISKNFRLFFKKVLICHSEPAKAGEESINSRHFSINSWILPLRYAQGQNDKYGILSKINTFLKKSQKLKNFKKLRKNS